MNPPGSDLLTAFLSLAKNTQLWARSWLENRGELPAACHHIIAEKLSGWRAAVTEGGPELRAALLAAVPPIPPREPELPRAWTLPAAAREADAEVPELSQEAA